MKVLVTACSSVSYHARKSELSTLGIGETAGFVVNVSIDRDDQVFRLWKKKL